MSTWVTVYLFESSASDELVLVSDLAGWCESSCETAACVGESGIMASPLMYTSLDSEWAVLDTVSSYCGEPSSNVLYDVSKENAVWSLALVVTVL